MKIAFFFLTLVGISLSQTTLSCREIRDRANCTASSNTGASRCQWLSGRNCRGEVYEFCYENVGCGDALVCARDGTSTVGVPYLFPSTCIPPRFVAVDPQTCICPRNDTTNTCNPACGECRRCVEGSCVDPYANFRKCSSSTDCPNGMRCDTTSNPCLPSCVADCPNPTQCLIDPCETPRPAGCPDDAVCVPYYCNGCGRKFFDATGNEICRPACTETECGPRPALPTYLCPDNTTGGFTGVCKRDPTTNVCAWEIKRCSVCPDNLRVCPTLFCRYGYETETITIGDITVRCPTCNCKPEPTCNRTIIACPAIVCSSPAAPIVENCCPTCPPRCDGIVCPQVLCVEGYEYKVLEGECCGTCVPRINCAAVQCGPTPVCGPGEILVRERCCPICRQVVNCSTVRCADPQCPAGFKPIVRDGSCCAECVPRPACDGVMCPACVGATTPVRTDLSCCPICRPIDFCATVLCALPNCPREKWITRDGECCPQCPRCTDTENRLCNPNDDSDCRAGHYTGSDCNVTVPPNDRVVREVIVRLCDCDTPQLDTQTIRIIAATLSNVDAKYVTVTFLGLADDNRCCKRYKITITAERTDSTVNVEAAATQVSEALSSNGWSVESTSEVSSGSVLFASAFLALLVALF